MAVFGVGALLTVAWSFSASSAAHPDGIAVLHTDDLAQRLADVEAERDTLKDIVAHSIAAEDALEIEGNAELSELNLRQIVA